jgi:hypothetical protein
VTRVMATREVARAVGLMTDEQRARLGCLLMELDTAEGHIAAGRAGPRSSPGRAGCRADGQATPA